MAAQLDNVSFTPTLGGTTDWTYSSTISGYQSPVAANATTGQTYESFAKDTSGNWEISRGVCTISAGVPTFARTTVLYNSAGSGTMSPGQSGAGTKINFAAPPAVSVVLIKESIISIEEANTFTPAQQSQALSNIGGIDSSFANKFRNGNFDVWQRGPGAFTVTTAGAYTADGWIVLPTGASVSVDRQFSSLVDSFFSIRITGATSVTDVILKQRIESYMAAPLTGHNVTFQAKVFNNTGASITPTLTVKRANAQDNWSATTTDVSAVSLQACPSGAWTTVAYTFAANASSYNGLEIALDLGNNFSTNAKVVQICECELRPTVGLPVGLNSSPPTPELRSVAIELGICQRYYQQMNSPAANTPFCSAWVFSATVIFGYLSFMPMRIAPTITSTAASTFQGLMAGTTFAASAIALTAYSNISCLIQLTVAAATAGQGGIVRDAGSSNSSLFLSAEL